MLLVGIGQGAAFGPLTAAGVAGAPREHAGAAAGLVNVAHQRGVVDRVPLRRGSAALMPAYEALPVYTRDVAKVMISLPDELLARLDDRARTRGTSRSGLLRELAERELAIDSERRRRSIVSVLAGAARHGGESAAQVREQRRER